jgi:hypothetical protein
LLRILPRDRLDVRSLREEIAKALQTSRQELSQRARQCMHFDGARRAAEQLLDCAQQADKRKGRSLEPRPATAFSLRLAPHEA